MVFLTRLEIDGCELLERIFEIEQLVDDTKVVPLRELSLTHLPSLKSVWSNDPGEFLTFPNLKQVNVSNCPLLKRLFPTSFVKYFHQIEHLSAEVEDEIFREDEASKLVFPVVMHIGHYSLFMQHFIHVSIRLILIFIFYF